MKKLIHLGIVLFITQCLLSQNSRTQSDLATIPPSPTAHKFSTHGNISMNNNAGSVSYQVPIYTINDKDIKMPISLAYSSNGVKVDEMAGIVGTDWILNAGGVISRVIRGQADSKDDGFWYSTDPFYSGINYDDAVQIAENKKTTDSERDWYSFNINGLSGTFYRDDKGEFAIESESYVKIIEDSYNSFTIIDGKGCTYKFGTTESSHVSSGYNQGSSEVSAWYLTEITTTTGNKLKISYTPHHYNYKLGYSASLLIQANSGWIGLNAIPSSNFNVTDNISVSNTEISAQAISKIEFSSGYVEFEYDKTIRLDNGGWLLKEISVYSIEGDKIAQKVSLNYSQAKANNETSKIHTYLANSDQNPFRYRYFLTDANFKNQKGQIIDKYTFEYYDKEKLPERLSFRRDTYGYYNAAEGLFDSQYIENKELQLRIEDSFMKRNFQGDLNVNPNTVYYGMLEKITYPTGGKTVFTYEANKTIEEGTKVVSMAPQTASATVTKGYESGITPPKPIDKSQWQNSTQFTINDDPRESYIYVSAGGTVHHQTEIYERITIWLKDLEDNRTIAREIMPIREGMNREKFLVQPGRKYSINISLDDRDVGGLDGIFIAASVSVIYNHVSNTKEIEYSENVYGGGVRISKITDYDKGGDILNEKKYYYNELKDINSDKTTLQYQKQRQYTEEYVPVFVTGTGNYGETIIAKNYAALTFQFRTSTLPILYNSRSNRAYYTCITEVSKNNGAVERFYKNVGEEKARDVLYGSLNTPESNTDNGYYGLIDKENIYIEKDEVFSLVKSIDYKYSSLSSIKLHNVFIERTLVPYDYYLPPNTSSSSPTKKISADKMVYISVYYDCVNNVRCHRIEEKLYDNLGKVQISQQTTNSYKGQPYFSLKTKSTNGSNENEMIEEFKYAPDLISQQNYMDELVKQNIVEIPIISTQKLKKKNIDAIQITSKQTMYDKFELSTGKLSYLPKKIEISGNTKDIIKQTSVLAYDKYSNPASMSENDMIEIVYLWSYKGLYPVAEIRNATYSEVSKLIDIKVLADTNSPNMTAVNGLREKLPNAHISTYTYTPLIGMTSATDASGVCTYYEYDDSGRLKDIYTKENNIKKVLQSFNYHYQNE